MKFVMVEFQSYKKSINQALDAINASEKLAAQTAILIKPNLINSSPHPITTSAECCEIIIEYIQKYSKADIIIAEGCGDAHIETTQVFEDLGYTAMAEKYGIPLVDLIPCQEKGRIIGFCLRLWMKRTRKRPLLIIQQVEE